ncbi:MAG: ATP-binding protein [Myxococcales bacterium]|nr:ATP-binding protein [Myxococcales bacterium]
MFRSSAPVTSSSFHDRADALREVLDCFDALRRGTPRWLAIVGPRKVGKTSLLLEAARRAHAGLDVAVLDVFERTPLDLEIFRLLVARALDALLAEEAGGSLARRLHVPAEFRERLDHVGALAGVTPALRSDLDRIPDEQATPDAVRRWLQIPEDVCRALDRHLVLAIDEVQELAQVARGGFEPFPVMRAVWQQHERVAYVLSGSEPTVLRALVTARHSPFFQHFHLFELGAFQPADAVNLLVDEAPPERLIARDVAERIVHVIGGHPFYLQMAGEALTKEDPPYDDAAVKAALQSLVFSRTGRLGLYFQAEYARLVGNAATLAATLRAVATLQPARLTDVARATGASTASTARYLERLGDAVSRDDDGKYQVTDRLFGTWLQWRSPGGTVVPMTVLGDEAERAVAAHLAALGFDLVYQSRGSRGAFDLLALRGPDQLGLQVKRSPLPLRFSKTEWKRMDADANRWGWRWAIAAVDREGTVSLLDPTLAHRGRELRLGHDAEIDNLLSWLDTRTRPQP